MNEPTEAAIIPIRRIAVDEAPNEAQHLIRLAVEGEHLEKAVREFSLRAGGALQTYSGERKWTVPLCEVLSNMATAIEDAVGCERRP